jgi:hypothetical protein
MAMVGKTFLPTEAEFLRTLRESQLRETRFKTFIPTTSPYHAFLFVLNMEHILLNQFELVMRASDASQPLNFHSTPDCRTHSAGSSGALAKLTPTVSCPAFG